MFTAPIWLRVLLVITLLLAATGIVGILYYKPSVHEVSIINFDSFPSGEWNLLSPIFAYYPEERIEILNDDVTDYQFVRVHISDMNRFKGFGFHVNRFIPPDSNLYVRCRTQGFAPYIQIDLVDSSPLIEGETGTETFSYTREISAEQWNVVKIPLNDFRRNAFQNVTHA